MGGLFFWCHMLPDYCRIEEITSRIVRKRQYLLDTGTAIGLAKTVDLNWFQIVKIFGERVQPQCEIYLRSPELQEELRESLKTICDAYDVHWQDDPPEQQIKIF